MEGEPLFYSPYFNNCQKSNDHSELFPTVNSHFDFTLEDSRDKPASTWSIKKIGALQSRFEKNNTLTKKNISKISMHDLLSLCNEVFGFDGWYTEIINVDLTSFEEINNDSNGNSDNDGADEENEIRYDEDGLIIVDTQTPKIRYNMEVTTTMRVVLSDGTYHDADGVGKCYNLPFKLMLFTKCKKESITNGIKNCILDLRDVLIEFEKKRNSGYYV